jgi:hypothetical protein
MVSMTNQPASMTTRSTTWAEPVAKLSAPHLATDVVNINVDGRQLVGPLQGFGQLWQKRYRVRLSGVKVTPAEVIRVWKANFASFWPKGCRFCPALTGIAPGEVAVLNLPVMPGGVTLSTGIMVIYADDESFTFMNPQGHMFAGWITFSAYEEDGATVAQAEVLIRANDPSWEIAMRLFGFKREDDFWHHTLRALAAHFGVTGIVDQRSTCIDPSLQWSQFWNIWHNAAMRSMLYFMLTPLRKLASLRRMSAVFARA